MVGHMILRRLEDVVGTLSRIGFHVAEPRGFCHSETLPTTGYRLYQRHPAVRLLKYLAYARVPACNRALRAVARAMASGDTGFVSGRPTTNVIVATK